MCFCLCCAFVSMCALEILGLVAYTLSWDSEKMGPRMEQLATFQQMCISFSIEDFSHLRDFFFWNIFLCNFGQMWLFFRTHKLSTCHTAKCPLYIFFDKDILSLFTYFFLCPIGKERMKVGDRSSLEKK